MNIIIIKTTNAYNWSGATHEILMDNIILIAKYKI